MVTATPTYHDPREIAFQGAWPSATGDEPGPTLLERREEDFLDALLADLQSADPAAALAVTRPSPPPGRSDLRLFQPVHRVFHLALLEAHCRTFGEPRLHPRHIESAGLVLRRVATDPAPATLDVSPYEAWFAERGRASGWRRLTQTEAERDPDPARRAQPRLTPDPAVDRRFLGPVTADAESHSPLFVAPPETASQTGRTLLYGVLSLTSPERAGEPEAGTEPTLAEWQAHLEVLLKAGAGVDPGVPRTGNWQASHLIEHGNSLFLRCFRQLSQEFQLFTDVATPATGPIFQQLNTLRIPLADGATRPLGEYLRSVARVLEDLGEVGPPVPFPTAWPSLSAPDANQLALHLRARALEVRQAVVAPLAGRFEDSTRRYAVRAFLRIRCPEGCPSHVVWSDYSEPFEIAPWYEPGPAGPVVVPLPDPFDRNFLKRAKPGVAFAVPARLANFVNQDAKEMLKGNVGSGSNLALDWICGFNIPIITICAFIVLSLFLSLFDLVLRWLLFVKICIPFPRKK